MTESAYVDRFTLERLPPREQWPELLHLEELGYPERLNVAKVLLQDRVAAGFGAAPCVGAEGAGGRLTMWSYADVQARAEQVAHVLCDDCGLVPGERVLLRAPNTPMLFASYLGVLLAGGVVVATMPLLRAKELSYMIERAKIRIGLCDQRLLEEAQRARSMGSELELLLAFGDGKPDAAELERRMADKTAPFEAIDT
ncbi:MAG TPA: AMP-binding protein, partial [Planctomycetota bacterium]|nr:AMP-binding protein [Planctomycetota bacterium]